MIHTGDCIEVMRTLDADSVDAVVTDPPYGLEFMGKEWDKFAVAPTKKRSGWDHAAGGGITSTAGAAGPFAEQRGGNLPFGGGGKAVSISKRRETAVCRECGRRDAFRRDHGHGDQWEYIFVDDQPIEAMTFQAWCEAWGREALRVTKPGGYLLAFGGTRTHHRLVCGLEDAGWIIRDELDWIYASGFPKGKANLKPAHEPIVLARKPGPLRPLAIDACRIPTDENYTESFLGREKVMDNQVYGKGLGVANPQHPNGRWPSNLLLQDPELFDTANPYVVGSGAVTDGELHDKPASSLFGGEMSGGSRQNSSRDTGGYSRFFTIPAGPNATEAARKLREAVYLPEHSNQGKLLDEALAAERRVGFIDGLRYAELGNYPTHFIIPKADRADREPVLRGQLDVKEGGSTWGDVGPVEGNPRKPDNGHVTRRENSHPTVKPVDLMRHLVRLVTPAGGTVLDCFLGSGSTAIACEMEGFPWLGIEQSPEYVAIAEARLNGVQRGLGLDVELVGEPRKSVDGVAVRHNSGGKTFGSDKDKPPMADMTYRQPKSERVSEPEPTEAIWPEEAA